MKLFLPGGEEGGGRGRGYGPRLDCLTTPFVTKENSFSSALVSYEQYTCAILNLY